MYRIKKTVGKHLSKANKKMVRHLSDYYFVSYPKCGRTWTRYFLASYMKELCDRDFSLEFDNLLRSSKCDRRIIYTHAFYGEDTLSDTKKVIKDIYSKKIIFLARDPRDVVTSLYFHYKHRDKKDDFENIDISEFVRNKRFGLPRIVDYMNLWYRGRDGFSDFLLLRYESLQQNPDEEFAKLIEFLDIQLERSILHSAINDSSFENMRKAERSKEVENSRLKPGDKSDEKSYKTRQGKVGGYKKHCDKDTIDYMNDLLSTLDPDLK